MVDYNTDIHTAFFFLHGFCETEDKRGAPQIKFAYKNVQSNGKCSCKSHGRRRKMCSRRQINKQISTYRQQVGYFFTVKRLGLFSNNVHLGTHAQTPFFTSDPLSNSKGEYENKKRKIHYACVKAITYHQDTEVHETFAELKTA